MFSIKRAVVTLVAGVALLAAAGPARALSESGVDPRSHNTNGEDSRGLWTAEVRYKSAADPLAADAEVDGLSDDLELVSEGTADAYLAVRFTWRQPLPRREQEFISAQPVKS
jgi:hypothetical protein